MEYVARFASPRHGRLLTSSLAFAVALAGITGCHGPTVGEVNDGGAGSGGAAGRGGAAGGGTGGSGTGGAAGKAGAGGTAGGGGAAGAAGGGGGAGAGGAAGKAGTGGVAGTGGAAGTGGVAGTGGGAGAGGAAGKAGTGGFAGTGGAPGTGGAGGAGGAAGKAGTGGVAGTGGAPGTGGVAGAGGAAGMAGAGGPAGAGGAAGSAGGGTGGAPDGGTAQDAGPDGGDPNIIWQYLAPAGATASAVAVDSAHVIHVAGAHGNNGFQLRLDENGNPLGADDEPLDPYTYTDFSDVAIDAADNVYFVGELNNGGSDTSAYVRWGGVGGTSWGHTETYAYGQPTVQGARLRWVGAKIDSQGRLVVDGQEYYNFYFHLILRRYLPAGGYDLDFAEPTLLNDEGYGLTLDGQDNIYVAGVVFSTTNQAQITGFLAKFAAGGGQTFSTPLPNKSTCTGGQTYAASPAFDGSGGLWLLGNDCDHEIILRQYNSTNGVPLRNADMNTTPNSNNAQGRLASDGTTLAFVGSGGWSANEVGFQLTDTDLQGTPIRKFSLALTHGTYNDALTGVAFIGRDRIVVGNTMGATTAASQIWVARIRAP